MNQLACRQFGIAELTPETLGVLEGNPLFSIDHPVVAGVDSAGNANQAIVDLHEDMASRLGLTIQQEDYEFIGFGRNWHRDGGFLPDDSNNYCLYTTIRNISLVLAAAIKDEVGNFYHIPKGNGNSILEALTTARTLQENLVIGAVARTISNPTRTTVWREARNPSRDTAHAVVAVKDTRLSYVTRWKKPK